RPTRPVFLRGCVAEKHRPINPTQIAQAGFGPGRMCGAQNKALEKLSFSRALGGDCQFGIGAMTTF
ncbi:hypothetical protein AB2C40_33235, partial [Pseudomonas aeruginosa]